MKNFSITLLSVILAAFSARADFITFKSADAPEKFPIHELAKKAPAAVFSDGNGRETHFTDFKGKIVLVNFWSKACKQCTVELPMLDALQKSLGVMKFKVVALSVGKETAPQLAHFFMQKKLKNLKPYTDSTGQTALAAGVVGLPTTLLLNENGEEIGRIRGIAEWTGAPVKAQLRELIRVMKEKEQAQKDSASVQNSAALTPETVSQWFKK